jgi:hypothetical protein
MMAKTSKSSSKKSAAKMAVPAGPSGKMHTFSGAGSQAEGRTAVTTHKGKGGTGPTAGPSGKMQKFPGVKTQKPGVTSQSNSGGGSYAKK